LPGGLHRLLSRNEKTTGARFEPARGFSSSIDSCQSTDLTPARPAKKAAKPKVKTCKRPTLIIHSDATSDEIYGVLGNKKCDGKQAKNHLCKISSRDLLDRIKELDHIGSYG